MTKDESYQKPDNLINGLSVTPLCYLIPKQNVAPLIGSASIEMIETDLIDSDPITPINQMRKALNDDPAYFKEVIDFLVEDFQSNDPELDDIKFKKPLFDLLDNGDETDLQLPYFEKKLFDVVSDVREDSVVASDFKTFEEKPCLQISHSQSDSFQFGQEYGYNEQPKFQDYSVLHENYEPILKDSSVADDSKRKFEDLSQSSVCSNKKVKAEKPTFTKSEISVMEELEMRAMTELIQLIDYIGLEEDNIDDENGNIWCVFNDEIHILAEPVLVNIENCLQTLVNKPGFQSIDLAYLIRIETLTVKSIKYCLDMELSSLVDDQSNDEMMQKMGFVTNGLRASSIVLIILNCQRIEKQLFVEDFLKSIVEMISLLIEDVLIPFAAKNITDPKFISQFKASYSSIIHNISRILRGLSYHVKYTDVDDTILTKLEYLSSKVVFAEATTKEKMSILGVANFETLRYALCDIICTIFHHKKDQRQFILDEILSNFEKLPSHRIQARQFKLTRGVNIQLATALLMRIIHSFNLSSYKFECQIWKLDSPENLNDTEIKELQVGKDNFINSSTELFKESIFTANNITSFLLSRLASNCDAAHKHSFELLLEDLLNVIEFPEWPAAETLLVSIMKTFLFVIESNSYSSLVETFALEMIGLIGVKMLNLKKRSKNENHEDIFSVANLTVQNFLRITSNYKNCLKYLETVSSKESKVKQSYHFLFLKLFNYLNSLLNQFQAEKEKEQEMISLESSQPSQAGDSGANQQENQIREDLLANINSFYFKILAALEDRGFTDSTVLDSNRDSNSVVIYTDILLNQDLLNLYDNFLGLIVRSLDHSKIKSRTRAIKNLSSLIAKEPALLTLPQVRVSISRRLTDSSPLVRDAVIDLLSQYIVSKPEVIEEFYQPTCERINDHSVQVRKRVIKLAREMYINTNKRHVKSLIAEKLLRRIHDEDDAVSDLVKSYLIDLWFTSLINDAESDTSPLATPALQIIEIIIDVIGKGDKNLELFETFFKSFVLHRDKKNEKIHDEIMKAIKLIIEKTLDFIIDCSGSEYQKQVEKAMGLLSVFAKCDGKLMDQDQLISLQPYLMNEETTGNVLCFYTLQTFRYTLPQFTVLKPTFIDVAQKSLLRRLTKFNVKELNEAIPCIWMLSVMRKDTIKIANAAVSCLKMLKPFLDGLNKKALKVESKLQRLLYLVGNFGTYCDFESHREIFMKAKVSMKGNETVLSLITKTLLAFCKDTLDHQIRRIAIRNLINICSMHPKLFMSNTILQVLDREFASDEIDIKEVMIQGIIDFLEKEEAESVRRNGLDIKSSKETKLDVAVFHGESKTYAVDGICVSIVQRFMKLILKLCLYDDGLYSYLCVKFLQLVVKLGFANPRICIPTVIALESSPNKIIKDMAIGMHSDLIEKHESLIEPSYVEGIKLGVRFRKSISRNMYNEKFFMKNFYSVIKDTKSGRRKFFVSLIKTFYIPLDFRNIDSLLFHRDYLNFLFLNMSIVELGLIEEVMILIHGLNQVLSREGINLTDLIKEKENEGATNEEWIYLGTASQCMSTLITFKHHLVGVYNISEEKISEFKISKIDKELRQAPKSTHDSPLDLGDFEMFIDQSASVDTCKQVCNEYIQLANEIATI